MPVNPFMRGWHPVPVGLPDEPTATDAADALRALPLDPIMIRRACMCRLCGAPADRYCNRFQCQVNPNHVADLNTGLFNDLTPPVIIVWPTHARSFNA